LNRARWISLDTLERSKILGDELVVIVARDLNVRHKPKPVVPEEQRQRMVQSLKAVDRAILGEESDIFRTIEQLKPDIITLGFDQHFDIANLETELSRRGLHPRIVRIEAQPLSTYMAPSFAGLYGPSRSRRHFRSHP
jgi:FAD synthetase